MPIKYNLNTITQIFQEFPDIVYSVTLVASTEQHFTVPGSSSMGGNGFSYGGNWVAVFKVSSSANVYATNQGTAGIATGTIGATTAPLIESGDAYILKAKDVLSLISAGTPTVTISLYALD